MTFDPSINWATLIQALAFATGIAVVWFQLANQRHIQIESHRIQMKKEIYTELTKHMQDCSPTRISVGLAYLVGSLKEQRDKQEENGKYVPPPFTVESYTEEFRKIQAKLFEVTGAIERYEIVGEYQSLFRRAFVAKLTELSDSFLPLIFLLPYLLLSEKGGITDPDYLHVPTDGDLESLQDRIDTFSEIAGDIDGFLYDVQIEAQMLLLGELFETTLEVRKPKDDTVLVLTSRDEVEIKKVRTYVYQSEMGA